MPPWPLYIKAAKTLGSRYRLITINVTISGINNVITTKISIQVNIATAVTLYDSSAKLSTEGTASPSSGFLPVTSNQLYCQLIEIRQTANCGKAEEKEQKRRICQQQKRVSRHNCHRWLSDRFRTRRPAFFFGRTFSTGFTFTFSFWAFFWGGVNLGSVCAIDL